MKKKTKIIITILIAAAALGLIGTGGYYTIIRPKVEEALMKAQEFLEDEKIQVAVDALVEDMAQKGEMDDESLQEYNMYKEAMDAPVVTENKTTNPLPATPAKTPVPKLEDNESSLMKRVKAAMTKEEFSFAMSMYNKVDVSYCISMYFSDKKELKKYLKGVLTSEEISRSLAIYKKYSYLVK